MTGVSPQLLGTHAFLRGLAPGQLALLAETASDVCVPAGFRFFEEGGRAAQLWLISRGHVALDLAVPGRRSLIVETVGAGEVIGLSWLTPAREWQFGAEAVENATAFELDAAAIGALLDSDPALGYQLVRRLMTVAVTRLQATRIRLLDLYATAGQRADAR